MATRLLTWNVAGRVKVIPAQLATIVARRPDIVALQEVRAASLPSLRAGLREAGLGQIADSFSLAPDHAALRGPRAYGELIASRWPVEPLPPEAFRVPWPERVLSATVSTPAGPIEVHTAHVPPGVTNAWIKIETLEGIFGRLARWSAVPRVLCGDFNTPQEECADGSVITWAQRRRRDGRWGLVASLGERWDAGERNVLRGLAAFDLADVFHALHGCEAVQFSWYARAGGRAIGRRFDHVFASRALNPTGITYLDRPRLDGLSDHAALEADLEPKVTL